MPFTAATCPNCGGNLQLEDSAETGFCQYCGSRIVVKDAIQKYKVEISGRVSMSGISSVENDIKRGQQCLAAQDWKKAFEVYNGAIDKQADSYEAWLGCLTAMTQDYTYIDCDWVKFEGINGIDLVITNCLKYGNTAQKENVKQDIEKTLHLMEGSVQKDQDEAKQQRPKGILLLTIGLTLMVLSIPIIMPYVWWLAILSFLLGGGMSLFGAIYLDTGSNQKNNHVINCIQHIRVLLENIHQ